MTQRYKDCKIFTRKNNDFTKNLFAFLIFFLSLKTNTKQKTIKTRYYGKSA